MVIARSWSDSIALKKNQSRHQHSALIGIAGVHYVAAERSRRQLIALPTTRNTGGYDIVFISEDGDRRANIQVKTSSKRTTFFPMPSIDKMRSRRRDFYVLVRCLKDTKQFEGFMLTGSDAKRAVQQTVTWQTANIRNGTRKGLSHAIDVSSKSPDLPRRRRAWNKWSV